VVEIISEIGINHNGDFRLIEELIRQSSAGGSDFAKFQLYSSERVFGDSSRKKNEFTFDQVNTIKQICDAYNIEFFASVFDEEKLEWCIDLQVSHIKIASRTLKKEPSLCRSIIQKNLKTYISLGMWDSESLPYSDHNVGYFNCISKYPTSILDLKKTKFLPYSGNIVGYSDHSYGIASCLHQISNGASIIEKHFTLNKGMPGNDHVGSMNIEELKQLRDLGDQISSLLFRQELDNTKDSNSNG
jgi:sialic acid synthase SpsE